MTRTYHSETLGKSVTIPGSQTMFDTRDEMPPRPYGEVDAYVWKCEMKRGTTYNAVLVLPDEVIVWFERTSEAVARADLYQIFNEVEAEMMA